MARRVPGKMLYSDNPDWVLRDNRSFDNALVTANVGSYLPNPWGLHDLHGNAAEWSCSDYARGRAGAAPGQSEPAPKKAVRGGSWRDRPKLCRSASRWGYDPWQKVYNVGFRVIID